MAPSGNQPNRFRTTLFATLIALGTALVGLYLVQRSWSASRAAICARWMELSAAVAARDTDTERSLIAPDNRERFEHRFQDFVSPLGPSPTILIFGDSATIWPDPKSYLYKAIPIGHAFEMIRVDGIWYFTGELHIN